MRPCAEPRERGRIDEVDSPDGTVALAQPSALTPAHYHAPAIFVAERARLFETCWQFVGFAERLRETGDFITARLAGRGILVRNFDGALKGFRNVCAHRQAQILGPEYGHGPLRCPYHGWTYDRDGVPLGIPGNEAWFGLDRAAKAERALSPVAVARCGALVFARLAADGPDLETWLGDFAAPLARISETFTDEIANVDLIWPANWKIAGESTLETYHVDVIHRSSLGQVTPNQPFFETRTAGPHSLGHLDMAPETLRWWTKIGRTLKLDHLETYGGFDHFHIFPNLFIPVSAGRLMCLQTYEPLDPTRCRLRYSLRLARATGPQSAEARRIVAADLADINRRTMEEDMAVTARVQTGVADATRPALLGANEARLRHFHDAYRAAMAG
jgi:phenylpropionate dioxygenase-like ring-hydroxylating dioxygenase large terminal subunit